MGTRLHRCMLVCVHQYIYALIKSFITQLHVTDKEIERRERELFIQFKILISTSARAHPHTKVRLFVLKYLLDAIDTCSVLIEKRIQTIIGSNLNNFVKLNYIVRSILSIDVSLFSYFIVHRGSM